MPDSSRTSSRAKARRTRMRGPSRRGRPPSAAAATCQRLEIIAFIVVRKGPGFGRASTVAAGNGGGEGNPYLPMYITESDDSLIYALWDRRRGVVKFGTTTSIERRQAELELEFGDLQLVWFSRGGVPEEKAIHRRFTGRRIPGSEWFRPNREIESFIGVPLIPDPPEPTIAAVKRGRPPRTDAQRGDAFHALLGRAREHAGAGQSWTHFYRILNIVHKRWLTPDQRHQIKASFAKRNP